MSVLPGDDAPALSAAGATRPIPGFVSIVIPCLNEELVVGEFVDWCHEGLAKAGVDGRDPDRRQLHRPLRRDRRGARRAGAARAPSAASGAPTSTRCPASAASGSSWATATSPTTSARSRRSSSSSRAGCEFVMGSRFEGLHRAGRDARPAPLLRHAADDLDPQPHLHEPASRDIHCGMRAMTADALRAHRPAEPVVGVRLRDGAQGGQAAPAHRPRCRCASTRTARAARATTSAPAGGRRGRPAGSTSA